MPDPTKQHCIGELRFARKLSYLGSFLIACMFSSSALVGEEAPDSASAIRQLIDSSCESCHEGDSAKGGLDLVSLVVRASKKTDAAGVGMTQRDADAWVSVLEMVQADLMPPARKKRPAPTVRNAAIHWVQSELRASGLATAYFRKLELPEFGNNVDHDLLFSGEVKTPAYSSPRLWRISPYIFESKKRVGRVKGVQNPFSFSTPATGLRDFAVASLVDSSTVDTILLNARSELDYLFRQAELSRRETSKRRRRVNPFEAFLDDASELTEEQIAAPIRATFLRLVSREPTEVELSKYTRFFQKNFGDTGERRDSLETVLSAVYLSPEAIFRMEWGLGPKDEHGRRMLSPEEIAYSLSYALFDSGPFGGGSSRSIREAFEAGELSTKSDVERVVRSILEPEAYSPIGGKARNAQPRVLRFFREFFGYARANDVFKDAERVASQDIFHDPRRLVRDADNLIKVVLREDRHVLEELLTTRRALVFHDGNNEALVSRHERLLDELENFDEEELRKQVEKQKAGVLKKPKYKNDPKLVPAKFAEIETRAKSAIANAKRDYQRLLRDGVSLKVNKAREYGYVKAYNLSMKSWKWPAVQPFELPADQRAGLLTHPAWLVAHSFNDGNDPVHRGLWVYSRLLAGVVPDLPPDVDARIPDDPHKTLRERLEVVRDKRCWSCHRKFSPLGEAFEIYDDFGRYRQFEFFDSDKKLVTVRKSKSTDGGGDETWHRIAFDDLVAKGVLSAKPVDSKGSFKDLGVRELQGEFIDAVDMMQGIGKSSRARQSMIRHLFRYLLGRNERLSDSRTLIEADRAYLESEGSFKALLISILSSDSFLYRR